MNFRTKLSLVAGAFLAVASMDLALAANINGGERNFVVKFYNGLLPAIQVSGNIKASADIAKFCPGSDERYYCWNVSVQAVNPSLVGNDSAGSLTFYFPDRDQASACGGSEETKSTMSFKLVNGILTAAPPVPSSLGVNSAGKPTCTISVAPDVIGTAEQIITITYNG